MTRFETNHVLLRDHEVPDLRLYSEMETDPICRGRQKVHPTLKALKAAADFF